MSKKPQTSKQGVFLVADSGNFVYLCSMEQQKQLQVVFMQEARDFIKSLPVTARKKYYETK